MKSFLVIALLILSKNCSELFEVYSISLSTLKDEMDEKWWTSAALYQIYPRSFQDSNGDGIGDIPGITSRLEYLKELDIKAFWVNPIFPSPLVDFGYDISDYYDIHPDYGTMADFEELIKKATTLGIGVLIDFVPNHSSDQCDWFKKSVKRIDPYTDYYIWVNGTKDADENPVPPNNWLSVFGNRAWTWNAERKQFYYHQFYPQQPDLNFRNAKVVEQMNDVFQFWMKKGLAGFRIDATNHLFEDELLRDEPLSGWDDNPNSWNHLNHIYTKDLPECHEMVYMWRKMMDDYAMAMSSSKKILITEAFTNIENTMLYYESKNGTLGSHFPYNGQLLNIRNGVTAENLKGNIDYWMTAMPQNHVADWPIGSHDNSRVATRVGPLFIGIMNILNTMLPGASITYYGEEIGMIDNLLIENVSDERDPCRTPMQWDSTVSAGFSSSNKTWLPVNHNFQSINVETLRNMRRSHFHHFKELMKLRKIATLMYGSLESKVLSEKLFAFTRTLENYPTYVIIVNLDHLTAKVNLAAFPELSETLTIKSSVYFSRYRINDIVEKNEIQIDGYDGIVLEANYADVLQKSAYFTFIIVLLAKLI